MAEPSKREHLLKLVEGFAIGFLATKTRAGEIHGRPMSLAKVGEEGEIYFSSGLQDAKIEEIRNDPQAGVFLQGKASWVALQGTVAISRDRKLIDELWSEDWKIWFPEGKNDPTLSILVFDTRHGEYWDNTGKRGVRFVIEAARAYIEGREADMGKIDENAKVDL